ncbi:MAG: hypothetical protein EBR10_00395 [Planctomycetes bacterium]|nr:hypothetical protein [Planctomycetota bacterium]
MRVHVLLLPLLCAVDAALIHHAAADGGAVVDRGAWGGGHFVLWVNPAPPTAGPAEWTLLHTPAPTTAPATAPTSMRFALRLEGDGGAWQEGNFDPASEGSVMHTCNTTLPFAGEWTVTLKCDRPDWPTHTVAIRVQPAPAAWQSALPWMVLWIPAACLVVLRESLAARQRRTTH